MPARWPILWLMAGASTWRLRTTEDTVNTYEGLTNLVASL
jgi:hypothetical protein